MTYHLFLDDVRIPASVTWMKLPHPASWSIVRSFDQFKKHIIEHGVPEFVTFDHDLHESHYKKFLDDRDETKEFDYGPEKTGLHCAQFLANYCAEVDEKFPPFMVHSLNDTAAARIERFIDEAKTALDI